MKQTAGRDKLGDLAPKFAELNDDVLFGEIWSRVDKLALRDRCMITVVALISKGITDNSLVYHLTNAKNHGVTLTEMVEIITHITFYIGWPNAWAVFPMIREVYKNEHVENEPLFGLGEKNTAYSKYFIGQSYLKPITTEGIKISNVTFEPGCRNNWHIHAAKNGGGQILLVIDGVGYYQEENKPVRKLHPGDVVYIKPNVKHWHGASKDSYFTHLAVEVPGEASENIWLEPVDDEYYKSIEWNETFVYEQTFINI